MFSKILLSILHFFYFEGLLLACPLGFETIDLTFVSKILVFDIES